MTRAELLHLIVSRDRLAFRSPTAETARIVSRLGGVEVGAVPVADLDALAGLGLLDTWRTDTGRRWWRAADAALGIAHQVLGDRGGQPMTVDDWRAVLAALEARC